MLLNCSGAAAAIENAAGYQFKKACMDYIKIHKTVEVGTAIGSHSFKLNSSTYIINAVGPDLKDTNQKNQKESLLEYTIKNCLDQCKILEINSIAIPAISSGIFGYKIEESSPIFIKTIVNYLLNTDTCLNDVWLVDIDQQTIDILENKLILYSTDKDSNVFLPFKHFKQEFSLSIRGYQDNLISFESSLKELINNYKSSKSIKNVKLSTFDYEKVVSICNLNGVEILKQDSSIFLNGINEKVLEVESIISSIQMREYSNSVIEYPIGWDESIDRQLIPIKRDSIEWKQVYDMISKTIPKLKLFHIEIVQNRESFINYQFTKKQFENKLKLSSGGGVVNIGEKLLFHGTKSNEATKVCFSSNGIDYRFSNENCSWGKGSYFAVDAAYSNGFASTTIIDGIQYKQFFIVKVLTGDSICIPSDNKIKLPPFKPNSNYDRYDSINGSNIYVIYDNKQSYPYYLVTYSC